MAPTATQGYLPGQTRGSGPSQVVLYFDKLSPPPCPQGVLCRQCCSGAIVVCSLYAVGIVLGTLAMRVQCGRWISSAAPCVLDSGRLVAATFGVPAGAATPSSATPSSACTTRAARERPRCRRPHDRLRVRRRPPSAARPPLPTPTTTTSPSTTGPDSASRPIPVSASAARHRGEEDDDV